MNSKLYTRFIIYTEWLRNRILSNYQLRKYK